jgi:NADH:ubiquinone oxidoreductase subunit 3 (subunit A)
MTTPLIYIALIIFFIFIFWAFRQLIATTRKMGIKRIMDSRLESYVLFIVNYKKGQEAEKQGEKKKAKSYYERALSFLAKDENRDELLEKSVSELKKKITELGDADQ